MQKFELALLVRDEETNNTVRFEIRSPELIEMARESVREHMPGRVSVGGWRGGYIALKPLHGERLLAADSAVVSEEDSIRVVLPAEAPDGQAESGENPRAAKPTGMPSAAE